MTRAALLAICLALWLTGCVAGAVVLGGLVEPVVEGVTKAVIDEIKR